MYWISVCPTGRPNVTKMAALQKKRVEWARRRQVYLRLLMYFIIYPMKHFTDAAIRYWDGASTRFSHFRSSDILKHNKSSVYNCHTWTSPASQKLQHSLCWNSIRKKAWKDTRKLDFQTYWNTTSLVYITVIRGLPLRPKNYSTAYVEIRYRKTVWKVMWKFRFADVLTRKTFLFTERHI